MNKLARYVTKMIVVVGMLVELQPILHAQDEATEANGEAIPAELNETRAAIFKLFNEGKYSEIAEQYCHEDITCLWNTGATSKGRQGVVDFFAHLKTFIDVMECNPTTQDRAVFADGKYVVSMGEMGDTYVMASGKEFELGSVWMATLAHEDDEWKLISFSVSTNAFDNQVIDAYLLTRTFIAGGIGIVIGFLATLILVRLRRRS